MMGRHLDSKEGCCVAMGSEESFAKIWTTSSLGGAALWSVMAAVAVVAVVTVVVMVVGYGALARSKKMTGGLWPSSE